MQASATDQAADGQQALAAILRAADELRRRAGERAEAHGITLQQFNVLRILADHDPAPLPTLWIGAQLADRTPGTSRLLERLAAKGLVRRERPAANRRVVRCSLTPTGRELVLRATPEMDELYRVIGRVLGEDAGAVTGALGRLAGEAGDP